MLFYDYFICFYIKKKVLEYEGSVSSEKAMSDFIKRKLKENSGVAREITSLKENTKAIPHGKQAVYFLGDKQSKQFEMFIEVAKKHPALVYLHTNSKEIIDYYKIKTPFACLIFNAFLLNKNLEDMDKPVAFKGEWSTESVSK